MPLLIFYKHIIRFGQPKMGHHQVKIEKTLGKERKLNEFGEYPESEERNI
jgi:hypothetical protein